MRIKFVWFVPESHSFFRCLIKSGMTIKICHSHESGNPDKFLNSRSCLWKPSKWIRECRFKIPNNKNNYQINFNYKILSFKIELYNLFFTFFTFQHLNVLTSLCFSLIFEILNLLFVCYLSIVYWYFTTLVFIFRL